MGLRQRSRDERSLQPKSILVLHSTSGHDVLDQSAVSHVCGLNYHLRPGGADVSFPCGKLCEDELDTQQSRQCPVSAQTAAEIRQPRARARSSREHQSKASSSGLPCRPVCNPAYWQDAARSDCSVRLFWLSFSHCLARTWATVRGLPIRLSRIGQRIPETHYDYHAHPNPRSQRGMAQMSVQNSATQFFDRPSESLETTPWWRGRRNLRGLHQLSGTFYSRPPGAEKVFNVKT